MADPVELFALRKSDFLVLRFEFHNLTISPDGALVRIVPDSDATIAVFFPPQHIAERIFTSPTPDPPVAARLSGASRLVFRMPEAAESLPITLHTLLAWDQWDLLVAAGALPDGAEPPAGLVTPQLPGALETSIEFPSRLLLSPDATARWRHERSARTLNDARQLWRTYLCHPDAAASALDWRSDGSDVRALAMLAGQDPEFGSLGEQTRGELVQLTSNYALSAYRPRPIRARQLALSALGATSRLEGAWDYPLVPPGAAGLPIDLRQYSHVAAQGRDHFVRTVQVGFLCGTGHRASIVTTVERSISGLKTTSVTPDGLTLTRGASAYLLRHDEVVIQQPEVDYGALASAYAFGGREMPLRSIRLLTLSAKIDAEHPQDRPFWLADGSKAVLFKAMAVDLEGHRLEFEIPLLFVPYVALGRDGDILAAFHSVPPGGVNARRIETKGQNMSFADGGAIPGSTHLRTGVLTYDIEMPNNLSGMGSLNVGALPHSYLPRFVPRILAAQAAIPAISEIVGDSTPLEFEFDPLYLAHGFTAANSGESFARFKAPIDLAFAAQRVGGVASPNCVASALSRTLGPVSKPDMLAAGTVDVTAFANARIIIAPVLELDAASASGVEPSQQQLDDLQFKLNAPILVTKRIPADAEVPTSIESRFIWKPRLATKSLGILTVELDHADLLLDVRTSRSPAGGGSTVALGRLRNATLSFQDAIKVSFDEFLFRSEGGKKTEFNATGTKLLFGGPLNFINSLQSILPADGFDDPPYVTVDSQGVVAGYTLGVPSVGVGIFSLQNIALAAALSIPFSDRPAGVRFSVSDRHSPFLLTVSGFGGGGFFAMAVSANGLEQVEATLEFGGNVSLNLLVASGGVYVMAGIYFGLTGSSVTLTGYLRCGGALEVLGLISISVEFYLAFTYREKNPGGSEVWGQASLTVCVKIAFFSKSISLSVERRFAGSDGDPPFRDQVTPRNWATYLLAFAD